MKPAACRKRCAEPERPPEVGVQREHGLDRGEHAIPAGEIGNKNPITVSTETWYSPELQMTVYSKISDPRTGDSIYRLSNIKRGEPAATLFMVPDGYTVKDTPSVGVRTLK